MRTTTRTVTLTATALLGLALLVPAQAATAAAETCDGLPATVVGTPDTALVATPGADVVVTNGASPVDTGDGDDVVCVTAEPGGKGHNFDVAAGAGDDRVLVVGSEGSWVSAWADLGPGRDEFRGGVNEDRVTAGLEDTVLVDRGNSYVEVVVPRDEALPDTVGSFSGSRRDGYVKVVAPGRRVVMDGRAGTISVDGDVHMAFGVVPRMLYGIAQHVTLVGTPGVDRLVATACASATVSGRGGDDEILRLGYDAPPHRQCPHSHMRASGGAGDDTITGTINNDVLRGGAGDDRLKGRRGKDRADGGSGRDRCLAERESGCER